MGFSKKIGNDLGILYVVGAIGESFCEGAFRAKRLIKIIPVGAGAKHFIIYQFFLDFIKNASPLQNMLLRLFKRLCYSGRFFPGLTLNHEIPGF